MDSAQHLPNKSLVELELQVEGPKDVGFLLLVASTQPQALWTQRDTAWKLVDRKPRVLCGPQEQILVVGKSGTQAGQAVSEQSHSGAWPGVPGPGQARGVGGPDSQDLGMRSLNSQVSLEAESSSLSAHPLEVVFFNFSEGGVLTWILRFCCKDREMTGCEVINETGREIRRGGLLHPAP